MLVELIWMAHGGCLWQINKKPCQGEDMTFWEGLLEAFRRSKLVLHFGLRTE